ncbi:hypothetical protein ACFFLS_03185 [Flavobacterium procerum]|uniref:Uncharacterized protein n=1 Tax=Flavobacterium procerum TaxID=1455569 RepID=A0ABV6BKR6_9FLAO
MAQKRKKIFYVPGMISLVLIPIFCFYHFYKVDAFKVYSLISFSLPDEKSITKEEVRQLRKYKEFSFNNEKWQQLNQLKEFRFYVRGLMKNYDTINGAKVHFGPKMDYDTYIETLNAVIEEGGESYIYYDDDMYILGKRKIKKTYTPKMIWTCGYGESNKEYFLEEERKAQLERNIALFKKNWILFAGYLGLVLLNLFALVKFNKNQKYNQK